MKTNINKFTGKPKTVMSRKKMKIKNKMKKIIFTLTVGTIFAFSFNAQTKKNRTPDIRYSSNKQSSNTFSTPTQSTTNYSSSRIV